MTGTIGVKLDDGALMPVRAHEYDAGLDIKTPATVVVPPHGSAVVESGVHVVIPHGYYGKLESKSGLNVLHDIVCLGGIIDSDYTGQITVKVYNMGDTEYRFEKGEKIVQLIMMPCCTVNVEQITEMGETERGNSGFGSTGK